MDIHQVKVDLGKHQRGCGCPVVGWVGGGTGSRKVQRSAGALAASASRSQHHHKQHSCGKLEFMRDVGAEGNMIIHTQYSVLPPRQCQADCTASGPGNMDWCRVQKGGLDLYWGWWQNECVTKQSFSMVSVALLFKCLLSIVNQFKCSGFNRNYIIPYGMVPCLTIQFHSILYGTIPYCTLPAHIVP